MAIDGKTIARHEREVFGSKGQIFRHWDADEVRSVHVLECVDQPEAGVTSFGTVDLSQYDNQASTGTGKPLRVEILGACASSVESFASMLATAALNVATGEYSLAPGRIHPRVVEMYEPEVSMKHLLFVSPFLWGDDRFPTMEDDDMAVAFLQAVPISDSEFAFARESGVEALEDRFAEAEIDVFDLDRDPVA